MKDLIQVYDQMQVGRFELPCHRIELLLAPGYHSKCFEGSGVLRAVPRTGFDVLMVGRATQRCLLDLWPYGDGPGGGGSAPSWYQLRVWDWEGTEWIGQEWVRPQIRKGFDTALNAATQVELRTVLNSITTSDIGKLPSYENAGELYEFIVPSVGHVWWSGWKRTKTEGDPEGETLVNRACFHESAIDGVKIVLEEGEDERSVIGKITASDRELPPFVDVMALQGLQLLTARMLDFGVQYRRGSHQRCLRLVGPVMRSTESRIPPPYQMTMTPGGDHYWDVFESFVGYLMGQPINPFFHSFIETLLLIMDASTRSWETYSLMLAVGVESLLPECSMSEQERPDELLSKKDVEDLAAHLMAYGGDERGKRRVLGFLRHLGEWGTTDRLRKLQEKGTIQKADEIAWRKLRNPVAHGNRQRGGQLGDDPLVAQVLTMLYRVILREAGYAGPINPFG